MVVASGIVVTGCVVFLLGLGVATFAAPDQAKRFLGSFASSARAHYTEQILRLIGGLALVVFAPFMEWCARVGRGPPLRRCPRGAPVK